MFAGMLFAISIVALMQFALYYWRAVLAGVATQPVSGRVLAAAQVEEDDFCGADFKRLAGLLALTPELKSGNNGKNGLGLVQAYFGLLDNIGAAFAQMSPAVVSWSERERALCARYAAVQIDRRLQANLAQAASMRSC
jgi:hypothetical protein